MIYKYENFFSEELFEKLVTTFEKPYMRYGWVAHKETDPHGHWNLDFTNGHGGDNLANVESLLKGVVQEAWEYAKANYKEFEDKVLIRCYMNGHTYGVDGYFHTDSDRTDELTCVIYLNKEWDKDWGGETVFMEDVKSGEIVHSSLPRANRAVMFPGNMPHCARGVSRTCYKLRLTFMFKTRSKRSATFEKLSKFLFDCNATSKKHKVGSLHDHLVRVYQLLEDKDLPEKVCLGGGLHSIFGTNAFKDNIFNLTETEKVVETFGQEACELAELFAVIDRPAVLEHSDFVNGQYHVRLVNDRIVGLDKETFDSLKYIEAANLHDQDFLDSEKYPNLYNLWHSKG